jgi:hypothetical protein
MKGFSNLGSFRQWLKSKPRTTRYAKEIIKKHKLNPKLSLQELRTARISELDVSQKPYDKLSSKEKDLRVRALLVKSAMLQGKNLKDAISEEGISIKETQLHLGKFLYHKGGKLAVRQQDSIERARWFFSKGERTSIVINNSETASLISKYLASVQKALRTGQQVLLDPFKKLFVVDINGKKYSFETDLNVLYVLHEMLEDDRPYMIYEV